MARMLGRLGWHGQCACCCGPDTKREVKRQEEREWRLDQDEPPIERCEVCHVSLADDPRPAFFWARVGVVVHDHCWTSVGDAE